MSSSWTGVGRRLRGAGREEKSRTVQTIMESREAKEILGSEMDLQMKIL